MRLSRLILIGTAIIVVCFGAVGGRVILREAGDHALARDGVEAARLTQLALVASSRLSFERGPMNGALGSEAPLPAARRQALDAARAATDAALDDVARELAAVPRLADTVTDSIQATRRRLGTVRAAVDGLIARPLANRTDIELNEAVAGMIGVIPELSPESGLPAARLDLEITETVLLNNNSATLVMLHALRELGVTVSMDDFGTGYSSLSYLRSFPFDKIKIDQCFVRDLSHHQQSRTIIRAVVALAKGLGMKTLAEGVETEDQLEELRRAGCDDAQGYLLGRPASAEAAAALARGVKTSPALA